MNKIILLIILLTNLMFADYRVIYEYKILHKEVVNESYYDYKIQSVCKDGYRYTIVFLPNKSISITQDFKKSIDLKAEPIECKDR